MAFGAAWPALSMRKTKASTRKHALRAREIAPNTSLPGRHLTDAQQPRSNRYVRSNLQDNDEERDPGRDAQQARSPPLEGGSHPLPDHGCGTGDPSGGEAPVGAAARPAGPR